MLEGGSWVVADGFASPARAYASGHFRPLSAEEGAPYSGWQTVDAGNGWAEELSLTVHGARAFGGFLQLTHCGDTIISCCMQMIRS